MIRQYNTWICFCFFFLWTNEITPPKNTHLQRKPFSQVFLSLYLCHFALSGAPTPPPPFFRTPAYYTYLQQCHFYGVITLLVCVSHSHLFPFEKVHCVQLFSCVYLCSFPPPLLLRLTSVITALDSSSDGKCFSIPLSPSLSLNLHHSLFLTKQITSWLL